MPQNIKTREIKDLQESIQNGGVSAAADAYKILDDKGYKYAGWAEGVVRGDTLSGNAALEYIKDAAIMGVGGEECRNLTPNKIDKIRIDMALRTLKEYERIANENNGILNRDFTYEETKIIHKDALGENGLSLDNWTLNTPMELIREKYGDQAVEKLWQQMRDTGGDGADAIDINSILLTFMRGAQNSQNPDVRQKAELWVGRFDDWVWWDILKNTWFRNIDDLGKNMKNWWGRAKNWVWPRDPIILDLDGNGLETVGLAANVHFDHDGDGVLTKTGWAGKNDALLVWDRNTNGSIDTGAELFGDFTMLPNGTLAPNGFAALAALDLNGDGVLDANDPAFVELKIWRDADQNGKTGTGELISLLDAGIVSLNLANTLKYHNQHGVFGNERLSANDAIWKLAI